MSFKLKNTINHYHYHFNHQHYYYNNDYCATTITTTTTTTIISITIIIIIIMTIIISYELTPPHHYPTLPITIVMYKIFIVKLFRSFVHYSGLHSSHGPYYGLWWRSLVVVVVRLWWFLFFWGGSFCIALSLFNVLSRYIGNPSASYIMWLIYPLFPLVS